MPGTTTADGAVRDVAEMLRKPLGCWKCGSHDEPLQVWDRDGECEESRGGGAVREVVEMLLKAQGHWDELLRKYEVRVSR